MKEKNKTHQLVLIAIFIALSIAIGSIEVPYFPAPWLKFDLSEVVILIAINIIGADLALIVIVLRSVIRYFLTGGTNIPFPFYGELIAIIVSYFLILVYSIIKDYSLKKRIKLYELYLAFLITLIMVLFTFLFNLFFTVPAYSSAGKYFILSRNYIIDYFNNSFKTYFISIVSIYLPFNLIKFSLIFIAFNSIFYNLKNIDFFKKLLVYKTN